MEIGSYLRSKSISHKNNSFGLRVTVTVRVTLAFMVPCIVALSRIVTITVALMDT